MAAPAFTRRSRFFVPSPTPPGSLRSPPPPSRGFPFGPVSSHLPPPPSRASRATPTSIRRFARHPPPPDGFLSARSSPNFLY